MKRILMEDTGEIYLTMHPVVRETLLLDAMDSSIVDKLVTAIAQNDIVEARDHLDSAYRIREKVFGKTHYLTKETQELRDTYVKEVTNE